MATVFYPRPVLAFGYCRCLRVCVCVYVCLSVNHQLVRAITHQPFKLESPNLDQRCKRPWLRSLLFLGTIDLELQGEIELKSQNLPHFELIRATSHHQLKSVFPNLGQKCFLALLMSLLILGWIDLDVLFHFSSQTCLFYQNLRLIIHLRQFVYIQWDHRQWVLHIPHGTTHIRIPLWTRTVLHHGPWNSLVLYLGWTVGVQWAVDSAIGTGFYKLLSVLVKSYTPHTP